jgi:hypothetical protein
MLLAALSPTQTNKSMKEAAMSRVEALKGMALAGLTVALLGCPSSSGPTTPTNSFTAEYFSASLAPGSEVPAQTGNGTGTANLGTTSATSVNYSVSGSNVSNVTGVKIYKGASNANGTVEVTLCTTTCSSAPSSTAASIATGTLDSAKVSGATWSDFLNQLRTGGAYVEIFTSGGTTGAVRGQFGTASTPPNDPFFVLRRQ